MKAGKWKENLVKGSCGTQERKTVARGLGNQELGIWKLEKGKKKVLADRVLQRRRAEEREADEGGEERERRESFDLRNEENNQTNLSRTAQVR